MTPVPDERSHSNGCGDELCGSAALVVLLAWCLMQYYLLITARLSVLFVASLISDLCPSSVTACSALFTENSASLADALRAVMAARREQDNFQLIVITHDENFAHLIGTRQHAEFLWRITKDDNQRSHIAHEEILG